jgi:hypothetical protein
VSLQNEKTGTLFAFIVINSNIVISGTIPSS